eukprot:scaffold8432_cov257-Chaetoceros_neogracile.AAC.3
MEGSGSEVSEASSPPVAANIQLVVMKESNAEMLVSVDAPNKLDLVHDGDSAAPPMTELAAAL